MPPSLLFCTIPMVYTAKKGTASTLENAAPCDSVGWLSVKSWSHAEDLGHRNFACSWVQIMPLQGDVLYRRLIFYVPLDVQPVPQQPPVLSWTL